MSQDQQVSAHEITEFVGSQLAQSEHALVRLAGPRGAFTLAIPEATLSEMIIGLSDAAAQLQKRRASAEVYVTPVLWATIGAGPNDQTLVLGLQMDGGAMLHFGLPMNGALAFQDALATHLPTVAPTVPPPKSGQN